MLAGVQMLSTGAVHLTCHLDNPAGGRRAAGAYQPTL